MNSKWQPVQTAPKDGTVVLLWDGKRYHVGSFESMGGWMAEEDNAGRNSLLQPTHWMPLPKHP